MDRNKQAACPYRHRWRNRGLQTTGTDGRDHASRAGIHAPQVAALVCARSRTLCDLPHCWDHSVCGPSRLTNTGGSAEPGTSRLLVPTARSRSGVATSKLCLSRRQPGTSRLLVPTARSRSGVATSSLLVAVERRTSRLLVPTARSRSGVATSSLSPRNPGQAGCLSLQHLAPPLPPERSAHFLLGEGQIGLGAVVAEDFLGDEPIGRRQEAEMDRASDREKVSLGIGRGPCHGSQRA